MGNAAGKQHGRKYVHWDTAVTPAPPGKPHLVPGTPHSQPDVVTIRWETPVNDGGAPVTGYLVEHRRTGSPHWVRATPSLVPLPEVTLSGLEPGWRYQFRVSAENAVGLSEPGDVSEPLTVTLNRSTTTAPHFLQELRDVVTLENETAEFHVVFRGTPAPKVAWYKDGFEIFSSRRMRVVTEGDQSSLIIYQTGFSDEGDIKCTATNRVGHIVTKAKLRLEAPPRVRLPRQYEDGLLFEMGEVIRLKVSVAGRPLPRVTWLHNGEPIPFGGRYEVTNTERASALRVSEARRADRGEYQVRATSRLGEDSAAFLVTVTDRPMPPGSAKVVSTQGRTVGLTWSEPDDDGGCKIGNYIVEYYRIGWNVWLKAATCRQLSTVLEELIEGSEYKFRVKAENPYGVSDPSDESGVVFIPDPRRGLLEPPARKKGVSADNIAAKKSATLPLFDANKRKEIDGRPSSPPAKKGAADHRLVKSKEWETVDRPLPVISFDRVEVSRDFDDKNKENFEKKKRKEISVDDDIPPPVPPKTLRRGVKPSLDSQPQAPVRQKTTPTAPTQKLQQQQLIQQQQSVPKTKPTVRRGSLDAPRPTQKVDDHLLHATSPLMPREEDDSILHGSSELMLVLLPQSSVEGDGGREEEEEEEEEKGPPRRVPDFGQDSLQESVAPPLSLSAPELGSGDALIGAPLRNSVSSTELLHERAMARFYQAVAAEEAQKALERRRSIEGAVPVPSPAAVPGPRPRGASLTDEEEIRRVLRPRLTIPPPEALQPQPPPQPLTQAQAPPPQPPTRQPRAHPPTPTPTPAYPPALTRALPTAEEEQLDFARLRERLQDAPGGRLSGRVHAPAPSRTDSEESHESDPDAYHTGHSADASADVSADASLDYEDDEDEEEPYELRAPMPRPFVPRYSEEEDFDEEEDTYHPRSMQLRAEPKMASPPPARSPRETRSPAPARSPPPKRSPPRARSPLARSPSPIRSPVLARSPSPARSPPPEEPPPVPPHARSPLPSPPIVAPKPILKKPRSPSPQPQRSFSPSSPIRSLSPVSPQRSLSPVSPRRPLSPVLPERPLSPSVDDPEVVLRRRRSPAPAPEIPAPAGAPPPPQATPQAGDVGLSAAEIARKRRLQSRQNSLEEEEALARAINDHYGDIIREYNRTRKPQPKLFTNTAELKAAAEHQPRPLLPPKPPPPEPRVPPKPKEDEKPVEEPPEEPPAPASRFGWMWGWSWNWGWGWGQAEEDETETEDKKKLRQVNETANRVQQQQEEEEESEEEEEEESEEESEEEEEVEEQPPKQATPPAAKPPPPDPAPTPQAPEPDPAPSPASERPPPVRPLTPEEEEALQKVAEKKVRTTIEYLTDVAMFSVACWLYVFEDELYAVPVLLLMVYRQLRDAVRSRIPKFLRRSQ